MACQAHSSAPRAGVQQWWFQVLRGAPNHAARAVPCSNVLQSQRCCAAVSRTLARRTMLNRRFPADWEGSLAQREPACCATTGAAQKRQTLKGRVDVLGRLVASSQRRCERKHARSWRIMSMQTSPIPYKRAFSSCGEVNQ